MKTKKSKSRQAAVRYLSTMKEFVLRGNIYYIKAADGAGRGNACRRPAVVVSGNKGNIHGGVVQVVPITTSSAGPRRPTDVPIDDLVTPGIALCGSVMAVDKSRLGRYICHAGDATMEKITRVLLESMSLDAAA